MNPICHADFGSFAEHPLLNVNLRCPIIPARTPRHIEISAPRLTRCGRARSASAATCTRSAPASNHTSSAATTRIRRRHRMSR